jgi:xanthine/uracil/vitamin C permease (AzgA family)
MTTARSSADKPGKLRLTPEEARNWRLAKLFDLRSFVGALFVIFGVLVTIPGISASKATIDKSAGINLGLWVGAIMLVIGVFFVAWVLIKPPAPITTAEAEAARKAREEFGTNAPGGH